MSELLWTILAAVVLFVIWPAEAKHVAHTAGEVVGAFFEGLAE